MQSIEAELLDKKKLLLDKEASIADLTQEKHNIEIKYSKEIQKNDYMAF